MQLGDVQADGFCCLAQHLPCRDLGRFACVSRTARDVMRKFIRKCRRVADVFTQSCHLGRLVVERQSQGIRPRLVTRRGKFNRMVTARFGAMRCSQTYHVMDAMARMVRIKILIFADIEDGAPCDRGLIRGAAFELKVWPDENGWRGRYDAIGRVRGAGYRRMQGTYRSGLMNLMRQFGYSVVPRIQCTWSGRRV